MRIEPPLVTPRLPVRGVMRSSANRPPTPRTSSARSPVERNLMSRWPANSGRPRLVSWTCGHSTSCADRRGAGRQRTTPDHWSSARSRRTRRSAGPCCAGSTRRRSSMRRPTIGAVQIQNRGTLGGNIANASPAGDTLAGAARPGRADRGRRAAWRTGRAGGVVLAAYRPDRAWQRNELVLRIRIPLSGRVARYRKVGTRRAQAISKVLCPGVARRSGRDGRVGPRVWRDVDWARLGSPTPIRARVTERSLEARGPRGGGGPRGIGALPASCRRSTMFRSTADNRRRSSPRACCIGSSGRPAAGEHRGRPIRRTRRR